MQARNWRYVAIAIGLGLSCAAPAWSLTTSQRQQLKSLDIPIAVPVPIPAGFQVHNVAVEPCPVGARRSPQKTCRFGPNYEITYRSLQGACFSVIAVGGGIGGVSQAFGYEVEVPLFRDRVMLWFGEMRGDYRKPTAQQRQQPQAGLRSDWVGQGPFYSIRSIQKADPQCRRGITPNQAEQILRSLQFLS